MNTTMLDEDEGDDIPDPIATKRKRGTPGPGRGHKGPIGGGTGYNYQKIERSASDLVNAKMTRVKYRNYRERWIENPFYRSPVSGPELGQDRPLLTVDLSAIVPVDWLSYFHHHTINTDESTSSTTASSLSAYLQQQRQSHQLYRKLCTKSDVLVHLHHKEMSDESTTTSAATTVLKPFTSCALSAEDANGGYGGKSENPLIFVLMIQSLQ